MIQESFNKSIPKYVVILGNKSFLNFLICNLSFLNFYENNQEKF